jgi:phage gpG-like protein
MADSYMMDPFYALSREVESTKTKVADSVFEGYKLSVAQTNDINNRAMQVALHDTAAFAEIKQQIANAIGETMLAASRTDGAIGRNAMSTQALIMEQEEKTRELIDGLNTQNLNTALINQNTALIGGGLGYGALGLQYGGLNTAYQSAASTSAINALGSQIGTQSFINTGSVANSSQNTASTNIV